jgi:low temperature requirement protein LtrA
MRRNSILGFATPSLLRERGGHEGSKVGMIELFFDLVFVFAVTQLSHALLGSLSVQGAVRVTLLLVATWWVWIYTTWVTNWLDPERIPVRVAVFVLMLAGLLLAVGIPKAFETRGLLFAAAYVFMQVGRTVFFLWAVRGTSDSIRKNFHRILVWFCVSGIFWIIGGLADDHVRFGWWLLALAIDLAGPSLGFRVPGLGRSRTTEWDIEGGHLSERCALFVIIALGESVLMAGATFSAMDLGRTAWAGVFVSILGSILMWWLYFDTCAERAAERIRHAKDPGRQARLAYTYIHMLIVAGIIVCAVADDLVLSHPHHGTGPALTVILAGPAIYLVGTLLFKWVMDDRQAPPLSHLVGLVLLAALVWPSTAHLLSPLALSAATTGVLAVVAVWEGIVLRNPARYRSTRAPQAGAD